MFQETFTGWLFLLPPRFSWVLEVSCQFGKLEPWKASQVLTLQSYIGIDVKFQKVKSYILKFQWLKNHWVALVWIFYWINFNIGKSRVIMFCDGLRRYIKDFAENLDFYIHRFILFSFVHNVTVCRQVWSLVCFGHSINLKLNDWKHWCIFCDLNCVTFVIA